MKIIDLLNKIANEKKIPDKIKFNSYEYCYHDKEHGYCRNDYDCTYICLDSEYYLFDILNDEVEIIEEDNKIEKLEIVNNGNTFALLNEYGTKCGLTKHSKVMCDKINEIIDEVNKLKEK